MAILKVDTISGIGTEGPVFEGDIEFTSQNFLTLPKGNTTDAFPDFKAVPAASARGIFAGGISEPSPTKHNEIDFITIATTGNATDFGDLTQARRNLASGSSPTRGFFMGGDFQASSYYDIIDFVTIQSTGNAQDFGNLSAARSELAAVTSTLRACVGGGYISPSTPQTNIVEHITMATAGNMTDFGDLTVARRQVRGCSNGHGGLG